MHGDESASEHAHDESAHCQYSQLPALLIVVLPSLITHLELCAQLREEAVLLHDEQHICLCWQEQHVKVKGGLRVWGLEDSALDKW